MKDIVLWQSTAARERKDQHLRTLVALHQSATPPPELLQPVPRKLRWKRSLKFAGVFEVVLLVFVLCGAVWCTRLATQLYDEMVRDTRRWNERMREQAGQTTDPDRKAKIEKSIREGEEVERKWAGLYVMMLAQICMMMAGPVIHLSVSWFKQIRPELLLLREGTVVRASVVGRKNWFLLVPAVEFGFTTERGEHIRRSQPVLRAESPLFSVGDSAWVLHLPRRPKLARVYGLKSQIADIEIG